MTSRIAVIVGCSVLTACGDGATAPPACESPPCGACESPPCDDTGVLRVNWSLDPGCAGATSARVVLTQEGSDQPRSETFACEDRTAVIEGLALGLHEATLELLDPQGQRVALSDAQYGNVFGDEVMAENVLEFELTTNRGSLRMTWNIDVCPEGTEKVEVSVDGAAALTTQCWFSLEYPWYEIGDVATGPHEIVARVVTQDGDLITTSPPVSAHLEYGNQLLEISAQF